MRVLLDEQLDHRLKPLFDPEFQVFTVVELGWGGLEDREMLRAAEKEFDAVVTMDRGIPHQQNVRNLDLGIVLISAYSNPTRGCRSDDPAGECCAPFHQPGRTDLCRR